MRGEWPWITDTLIDGLLELAVVPSFSAIGVRIRRRLWAWTDPAPDVLAGRTALVTGATGGLGARHGAVAGGARCASDPRRA